MTAAHTLTQSVLKTLVCPVCHASLGLQDPATIRCTGCARIYPILDGLPVLLAARAKA